MRAVVLVGGFGTRLRPLTDTVPKPMLPVAHVPIIARLVARLEAGGVHAATLALGFRPEPFLAAFPDGHCGGVALDYAIEPAPLDTAGAIRFAAEDAGIEDTFVVANGDVVTGLDVGALVRAHRQRDAEATLHLIAVDDPSSYGVVDVDGDGRISAFVEKPLPGTEPSDLVNAGTYVLEPSVVGRIPADRPVSIERETFPAVAADGRLWGVATTDYWVDTGRPEQYRLANLDLLEAEGGEAVAPDATVDASATVTASVVGAGASVGASANVTGSVLLDGARVGDGATVVDSLVMGVIGPGAVVKRSVIGALGIVADGEHLADARRPDPEPPS